MNENPKKIEIEFVYLEFPKRNWLQRIKDNIFDYFKIGWYHYKFHVKPFENKEKRTL